MGGLVVVEKFSKAIDENGGCKNDELSKRKIIVKKNILANMKRAGLETCAVCGINFKENDMIVANSIRKRYCLDCAVKKNMI